MSATERLSPERALALDGEQLFNDYSAPVYRYCLARLGSPEEAEDAVQVTYLNAWRSLQCGTQPAEPRPWIFTIAANVCATILRNRLRGAKVEVRAPEDFDRLPSDGPPDDALVDLDAALKALPARQRQALLLRDWRGLSYEEIATELVASQPAVETLLFRARQAVAASLARPAQRVRRVPLRSSLSALLPWPWAFSGLRSSLLGGTATAKVALGIAVGATAPLVAFGILEGRLGNHDGAPVAENAAPAVGSALDAPQEVWGRVFPSSKQPRPAVAPDKSKHSNRTDKSDPQTTPTAASGATEGGGGATGPAASTETSPSPSPADDPPAEAQTGGGLIVICHMTGSKKNPAVTISVAAAAVEAHLAHGDELGACAG